MTGSRSKYARKELNERQLLILHYIEQGLNNMQIGEKLNVSKDVIDRSIDSIYIKLLFGDDVPRAKLPERARAMGIVFYEMKELDNDL